MTLASATFCFVLVAVAVGIFVWTHKLSVKHRLEAEARAAHFEALLNHARAEMAGLPFDQIIACYEDPTLERVSGE